MENGAIEIAGIKHPGMWFMHRVEVLLAFILLLSSIDVRAQSCDCPSISTCGVCAGGLISTTLKFNGSSPATITAADQMGIVFNATVNPGSTFNFAGSLPNEKFVGPVVTLTVNGVDNATFSSLCGNNVPGDVVGSFTLMAANSKTGGPLCCGPALVDAIKPVITACPANITQALSPTECSTAVQWTEPTATDNCTLQSLTSTALPGSTFTTGTTTVTYTATDIYGNTSTCSFDVVVVDDSKPVFGNCPSDVTVSSATCDAVVSWTESVVTDNCSVSVSSSHSPGSVFPIGTTLISYTAKDPTGNTSTCTFNVIVSTTTPPVISGCPADVEVSTTTDGEAVEWDEPTATATCGSAGTKSSHQPGDRFPVGTTTVVYEFEDEFGNKSTCSFDITVEDETLVVEVGKVVTPDGDGINDTWQIGNIEKFPDNSVMVVDRWGNVVFKVDSYDNNIVAWSGSSSNGARVPTGTYFFTIDIRTQGRSARQKGFLEVIR